MTKKKQRVNTEAAGRKNSGHLRIALNPLDITPTRYDSLRRFPNGCSLLKAVSQKTCVNVRQRFTEQEEDAADLFFAASSQHLTNTTV